VFERSLVSLAVAERPNYSNWRTQCIFAVTRESCKRRRPHGTESGADEAGAVWHEGFAAHSPPRHLHSEKSGAKKVSTAPHGVSRRNWQMTFVPVAEAATHAQCLLQIFAGIGAKSVPSCGIEGGVLSLCGRPRIAHPGDPSYPHVGRDMWRAQAFTILPQRPVRGGIHCVPRVQPSSLISSCSLKVSLGPKRSECPVGSRRDCDGERRRDMGLRH